jgi:anaerobic magnesium-protoporphyrin IX monomethyl ester cyclase
LFIEQYQPSFLNFDDDTFIKDRAWLFEFLDGYRAITALPFDCNSRPETINDAVCAALKAANCRTLCIGIESGSESFRKRLYGRKMSNKTIVAAFRAARAHGLQTFAFNMVGAPGETFRDYLKTVLLNRRIRPDAVQLTIYYPFPGSELYARAEREGLIDHASYSDTYLTDSLLSMKQFPKWQIRYAIETFSACVHPGKNAGLRLYVQLLRKFAGGWLRAKGLRK